MLTRRRRSRSKPHNLVQLSKLVEAWNDIQAIEDYRRSKGRPQALLRSKSAVLPNEFSCVLQDRIVKLRGIVA
jgi:hypothetical protein